MPRASEGGPGERACSLRAGCMCRTSSKSYVLCCPCTATCSWRQLRTRARPAIPTQAASQALHRHPRPGGATRTAPTRPAGAAAKLMLAFATDKLGPNCTMSLDLQHRAWRCMEELGDLLQQEPMASLAARATNGAVPGELEQRCLQPVPVLHNHVPVLAACPWRLQGAWGRPDLLHGGESPGTPWVQVLHANATSRFACAEEAGAAYARLEQDISRASVRVAPRVVPNERQVRCLLLPPCRLLCTGMRGW